MTRVIRVVDCISDRRHEEHSTTNQKVGAYKKGQKNRDCIFEREVVMELRSFRALPRSQRAEYGGDGVTLFAGMTLP